MDIRNEKLELLRASETPVLIGLGAIGSWVGRWLTANGIYFHAFDSDIVALKNLAAGAFSESEVGAYKTACIVPGLRARRWEAPSVTGTVVLVCADHGETRRDAAVAAFDNGVPFVCAKANGSLWQVWSVLPGYYPTDFIAFDQAAEANPVTTPCGDASVGRVASLGAAADLLSTWTGLEITPEEVEASYGVKYDPAIGHILASQWEVQRELAEIEAAEAAKIAYDEVIDRVRANTDSRALSALRNIRRARVQRQRGRRSRSTIHMRATCHLDNGRYNVKEAAEAALNWPGRVSRPLSYIAAAESRLAIRETTESLPSTITVEEAIAS